MAVAARLALLAAADAARGGDGNISGVHNRGQGRGGVMRHGHWIREQGVLEVEECPHECVPLVLLERHVGRQDRALLVFECPSLLSRFALLLSLLLHGLFFKYVHVRPPFHLGFIGRKKKEERKVRGEGPKVGEATQGVVVVVIIILLPLRVRRVGSIRRGWETLKGKNKVV